MSITWPTRRILLDCCWIHELRLKEGLVRLQTTQTLASSCGDSELRGLSLEAQGSTFTFWMGTGMMLVEFKSS